MPYFHVSKQSLKCAILLCVQTITNVCHIFMCPNNHLQHDVIHLSKQSPKVCHIFRCPNSHLQCAVSVQTMVWLPCLGFLMCAQMLPHVTACKRQVTLAGNSLPHWGIEPASIVCQTFNHLSDIPAPHALAIL